MPWFGKKEKTEENSKGKQKVSQSTNIQSSGNNTVERRVTYSSTSSTSYSSHSHITESRTITNRNGKISTLSAPNLSNLPVSISSRGLPTKERTERSTSLFETFPSSSTVISPNFELDARPFNPSTVTPNYQSPFLRSRSYGSARLPSTSRTTTNITSVVPVQKSPFKSYGSTFTNTQPTRATIASPRAVQNTTNNSITSIVPTYETNGSKRGNVIVINNIHFLSKEEERKGAEFDEKDISKLFSDMGFEVKTHRNLGVNDMKNKIKKFSSDKSLAKVDISIVIMMSHGTNKKNNNEISGSFTQIIGSDGKGLLIEEILAQFSADKCPGMKGKPKIFIFQCCRGDKGESIHYDSAPTKAVIKQHADMLIAYSTLPGFYSVRIPTQGSWYIQSICDVFSQHAKNEDIESLLKIVDDKLSKFHPEYVQTSNYENRGFKKCYLNPK